MGDSLFYMDQEKDAVMVKKNFFILKKKAIC